MMRVRWVVAPLAAVTFALVGCGTGDAPDTPEPLQRASNSLAGTGVRPFVLNYGGAPLICLKSEWGSGNTRFGGLSCDWERWRGEHPSIDPKPVTPDVLP